MAGETRGPIARALSGTVALLLGRKPPADAFDVSFDGFWRSFGAIVLVLPSLAVSVLAEARLAVPAGIDDAEPASLAHLLFIRGFGLSLEWIALPVVLALLSRPLGVTARYVPFIVVRNWSSVVAAAIYALPALLFAAGIIGEDALLLMSLVALAVVVQFQYRIVRVMLATPMGTSIAVVVLDLVLSLFIAEASARLIGA